MTSTAGKWLLADLFIKKNSFVLSFKTKEFFYLSGFEAKLIFLSDPYEQFLQNTP